MSPVHLRNLEIPRNQPEEKQGLFRSRRPGTGHLGHSCGCQDTEGNHTHSAIYLPIQQKPQTRGLNIWIKFFSSTNSSKICFNGAWITRG
ncbi:hypothetical protein O181_131900 [Austropuccinia psidii MF-1]|uniref:Uncharacterized protein n=1 Tax=Austropuccinia psidii MF-1 TaxID=1389203 RepID=A0A9Q3L1U9_9BASI|nr:hypothetical protein [Austropuccinia psidii MF-1]